MLLDCSAMQRDDALSIHLFQCSHLITGTRLKKDWLISTAFQKRRFMPEQEGRKPYPVLVPYPNLKYAKVSKIRRNGRVIEVVQSVVFGEPKEVMKLLGADSGGSINTAYIERLNLTIRNSLARFVRKTMNCSKILKRHTHALDFFQAWYNFVKPHKSLRLEKIQGNRRWMQRTPAMAERLTDHIWTMEELMNFRVPVQ